MIVAKKLSGGIEFVDVLLESFFYWVVGFADVKVFGVAVDLNYIDLPVTIH